MKTPNDDRTADMLPDGYPAFDLDLSDAWPMPETRPPEPEPVPLRKRVAEWLRRVRE